MSSKIGTRSRTRATVQGSANATLLGSRTRLDAAAKVATYADMVKENVDVIQSPIASTSNRSKSASSFQQDSFNDKKQQRWSKGTNTQQRWSKGTNTQQRWSNTQQQPSQSNDNNQLRNAVTKPNNPDKPARKNNIAEDAYDKLKIALRAKRLYMCCDDKDTDWATQVTIILEVMSLLSKEDTPQIRPDWISLKQYKQLETLAKNLYLKIDYVMLKVFAESEGEDKDKDEDKESVVDSLLRILGAARHFDGYKRARSQSSNRSDFRSNYQVNDNRTGEIQYLLDQQRILTARMEAKDQAAKKELKAQQQEAKAALAAQQQEAKAALAAKEEQNAKATQELKEQNAKATQELKEKHAKELSAKDEELKKMQEQLDKNQRFLNDQLEKSQILSTRVLNMLSKTNSQTSNDNQIYDPSYPGPGHVVYDGVEYICPTCVGYNLMYGTCESEHQFDTNTFSVPSFIQVQQELVQQELVQQGSFNYNQFSFPPQLLNQYQQ